ncbi:MAG: tRNA1(Val) (adenine(37)-N6)-methyltransferase [Clostridiaceae bacterium]|nr:tRNA1(Val) (adenine(37)-N6)-methyltransferase [Clostridiaceae bacterium]
MNIDIHENERLDDLQYKGLKLLQKRDGFCFGVDAVLLSHFADVSKNSRVIDLGTGTGIIAVLIAAKKGPREVVGLEIQPEMAEMAKRSVILNELTDQVSIVHGDIKQAVKLFGMSSFDAVVSNPPYMERGGGLLNPDDAKAISRHEILCTLEDVVSTASKLLRPGGKFTMIHRPQRLVDVICQMRHYAIEPKWLKLVHPSPGKKPNLVLIGGARQGNPELRVQEPLYIYDTLGNYSDEIDQIYNRDKTVPISMRGEEI